ncbi:MAG: DUF1573 domain-containing protein [Bacteroidia bacterium]|nr:DUF1573 domain-containing protein [Bacteroidia bacterium]
MNNKFIFSIILVLLFSITSCQNNTKEVDANIIETPSKNDKSGDKSNSAEMTFEHDEWDFGTITEGEIVEHTFSFKNTGNKTLLISDVQASCGCTVPVWPREPINPGKEGSIKIQFNSSNKHESIAKDVTVYSNAKTVKKILKFKAYVNSKTENK